MSNQLFTDLFNPRGNYRTYTIQQRMRAVELAKANGIRPTATALSIPKSTLMMWTKKFSATAVPESGGPRGRPLTYSRELENQILSWVLRRREQRIPVSRLTMCDYARKVVTVPGFIASSGWATAFMRRNNLVLRTRTSLAQMMPKDVELKTGAFLNNVRELRSEGEFELTVNMDETPVFFDLVPGKTVHTRGAKSVICRTTGAEKRRATAVLAISANGDALKPMVIFKGKRFPADVQSVPAGLHVAMQEKGWMTEELMIKWIETVLVPYTQGRSTLLVMDSFTGHTTDRVFYALTQANITPTIIPGGCTSKVQPLDVSINKPFKDRLRKKWLDFIGETAATEDGKLETASRQEILGWIEAAWSGIAANPDMISRAFEACGITAALAAGATPTIQEIMETEDSDTEFDGFLSEDIEVFSPRGEDPFN